MCLLMPASPMNRAISARRLRDDSKVVRAFYLAVAPDLFEPIAEYLSKKKLYRRDSRVVIEKPLGHDLASSQEINDGVAKIFKEDQVYRIDHYLGQRDRAEPAGPALCQYAVRARPGNSAHIADHVQLTVAESVGAGTRGYYDESGALRDMIQKPHAAAALPCGHGAPRQRRRQCLARRKSSRYCGPCAGSPMAKSPRKPCAASIVA
jgi:glucose-6-phosphate 1-dehydrogenase